MILIQRIFGIVNGEWRQFKVLTKTSLVMDFRSSRGLKGDMGKVPPLVITLIFYFLMSLMISTAFSQSPFIFIFFTLSYSMVMILFSTLLEFGNVIIIPEDVEILAFRPVSSRVYFFSRLFNVLFYVVLLSAALCLFPAIFGLFLFGFNWNFPLIYFSVSVLANLFSAAFVIWVYTFLLRVLPYQKFMDILAYVQIIFSIGIFLVYQLIPQLSEKFLTGPALGGIGVFALPSAWFAGLIRTSMGPGSKTDAFLAITAVLMTLLVFVLGFKKISMRYSGIISELQSSVSDKMSLVRKQRKTFFFHVDNLIFRFFKSSQSKAGYLITSNMLRRDRMVKTSSYSLAGMPFAFLALAILEGRILHPFSNENGYEQGSGPYLLLFFIFFTIYHVFINMRYTKDWEAGWIFNSIAIKSPAKIITGMKTAVWINLVLPIFVIIFIVFNFVYPFTVAAKTIIFYFLTGLVSASVAGFFIKRFPFSQERIKGSRTQFFSFIVIGAPLTVIVIIMYELIHAFSWLYWFFCFILLILFFILEKAGTYFINKRLTGKQPVL